MSQVPETTEETGEVKAEEKDKVDYQVPEKNVEEKNLNVSDDEHALVNHTGETGTHEIEVETEAVIDRIAEDTYDRDNVAIRELIANGETACKQAAEMMGDDYTPSIELEYTKGETLIVYDNGIGIEAAVFDQVFRHIARSTNRDDGDVSGQMGMGVYSIRNIIEDGASCTITTRSRRSEEEYKMYMHDGGFEPIPGGFQEPNRHGTQFEIPVKDSFGSYEIKRAVEKYGEFTDVQVILEIYDSDGNLEYEEDYPEKNLEDVYGDEDFYYIYEDEFVKAVGSDAAKTNTLLVNMPIKRNDPMYSHDSTPSREARHKWDLKIKQENGAIYIGEDEDGNDLSGLVPVPSNDYEQMNPERKDGFIPEDEVPSSVIRLPEPTSDRDRLTRGDLKSFYNEISENLREVYYDEIGDLFGEIDSTDDVLEMAKERSSDFMLVVEAINALNSYRYSNDELADRIEEKTGGSISEEVVELIIHTGNHVSYAPRNSSNPSKKKYRDRRRIRKVLTGVGDSGDVYMAKSVNTKKAKVVWDLDDNNQIVALKTGTDYKSYEERYGWKKLKDVTVSEVKDELSDDVKELVESKSSSNAGKDAGERKINLRRSSSNSRKLKASTIAETLTKAHSKNNCKGIKVTYGSYINKVIIFPPSADESVTNWYDFIAAIDSNYAVATVNTKMVTKYLKENAPDDSIMHIDDILTNAEDIEVTTTEGDVKLGEESDRLVLHTVRNEDLLERFRDDDIMERMQSYVEGDDFQLKRYYQLDDDEEKPDPLYAPISRDAGLQIKAGINNMDIRVMDFVSTYKFSESPKNYTRWDNSAVAYINFRLNEWENNSLEMEFLRKGASKGDVEQTLNVVDMMAKFHDAGIEPLSEESGKVDFTVNGQQASLGETVLEEAEPPETSPAPADD